MGSVGENIKELRERLNLSQNQLGERIGKSRTAIWQYEHGYTYPRMGTVEKLAHALGVDKTAIIGNGPRIEYAVIDIKSIPEQEMLNIMRNVTPEGLNQLMIYARGIESTYAKGD